MVEVKPPGLLLRPLGFQPTPFTPLTFVAELFVLVSPSSSTSATRRCLAIPLALICKVHKSNLISRFLDPGGGDLPGTRPPPTPTSTGAPLAEADCSKSWETSLASFAPQASRFDPLGTSGWQHLCPPQPPPPTQIPIRRLSADPVASAAPSLTWLAAFWL